MPTLEVVSQCPLCGSPIYGQEGADLDIDDSLVCPVHTCECRHEIMAELKTTKLAARAVMRACKKLVLLMEMAE